MKRSTLLRRSGLERGAKPLARRTPLRSGKWVRPSSALWIALEQAGIEHDKGIHERHRNDEEREAREWHRKYGSVERVLFVKFGGECSTPSCRERVCDNSHLDGEGTGRKGSYLRIFRQCSACHREMHDVGVETFVAAHPGLDPERECELLEIHWQDHGEEWLATEYGDDVKLLGVEALPPRTRYDECNADAFDRSEDR